MSRLIGALLVGWTAIPAALLNGWIPFIYCCRMVFLAAYQMYGLQYCLPKACFACKSGFGATVGLLQK